MSVLDNALQALLNASSEIKEVWRNASPNSSFAQQSVPINAPADCELYVVFSYGTNDNNAETYLTPIGKNIRALTVGGLDLEGNPSFRGRIVGTSTSALSVGNCYTKITSDWTEPNMTNSYLIPLAAYSIRRLGGGNS